MQQAERLNPDCKCLTWFKYSCILTSLASNSPWTWPTINLEFENISTTFPPIFCTMVIPANRALYSTSLFMVEKLSLKDFSIVTFSGDTKTSPSLEPLWFAVPLMYTLQDKRSREETMPTNFPSKPSFFPFSSTGDLANSATKSARIWHLTEVRGM